LRFWQRLLFIPLLALVAGCAPVAGQLPPPPAAATPAITTPAAPPAASTAPPQATPAPSAALAFSGQRAMDDVRWLADTIGIRPAGSDAERQAADEMAQRLRSLGYQVELQTFPIKRFDDRGSTLQVDGQPRTVRTLTNSTRGSVSGPLLHVGLARPEDLRGLSLAGAIALIERGDITFEQKVQNVADAGAIGAVIYNREAGLFSGITADESPIPVVALAQADGQSLVGQLANGPLNAELSVDADMVETTSQNVVATLPGVENDTVVLGAHYDSVPEGPGANDNASGAATVLELARVLPSLNRPYTVQVVLFGAEEIGLVGSRYFVQSLTPEARNSMRAMLNFDMVGVGEEPVVGGSPELIAQVQRLATGPGTAVGRLSDSFNDRSDHGPFLRAGVPSLFFHRGDDPRYHTADDQTRYVEAENLAAAGNLALALLREL
jgi:Iap family predicted aminopeptidase